MKTLSVFRILSVFLMVFMTLAAATTAYADAPVQSRYPFDFSFTIPAGPDACSFDVDYHESGIIVDQLWYDENGNLIKETLNFGDKIILSAYGKKVMVQGSGRVVIEPISEMFRLVTIDGHKVSLTIPGQGMVWGTVGKIIMIQNLVDGQWQDYYQTIKLVGKNMVGELWPLVCGYLGS